MGDLYNEAFPKQNVKISRNPEKELNYKQYKTLSESLKKKSKKTYYPDLIDSDNHNNKNSWDVMKKNIGNKIVSNAPLPNFITVKNRDIFDKKGITKTFNSYFVNIGSDSAASIPKSKTSFQNYIHSYGTMNLTGLGLENAFASLKTNKSSGYDYISPDVVKRVFHEIFVILKHIFNISLVKGASPDKLKIARVTPIFKKGNNTLVTKFYPVSQNYLKP